jgi:hypothetical protein
MTKWLVQTRCRAIMTIVPAQHGLKKRRGRGLCCVRLTCPQGEGMRFIPKGSQLLWLFLIVGIALMFTTTTGIAINQSVEPPRGLAEVKPATSMPAFSLPGVGGAAFDSSALQGKVVVVRFWATW